MTKPSQMVSVLFPFSAGQGSHTDHSSLCPTVSHSPPAPCLEAQCGLALLRPLGEPFLNLELNPHSPPPSLPAVPLALILYPPASTSTPTREVPTPWVLVSGHTTAQGVLEVSSVPTPGWRSAALLLATWIAQLSPHALL